MTLVYWITGFTVFFLLFQYASRSNRKRAISRSQLSAAAKLARENQHLRHVLAELSVDNHVLKSAPPDDWQG